MAADFLSTAFHCGVQNIPVSQGCADDNILTRTSALQRLFFSQLKVLGMISCINMAWIIRSLVGLASAEEVDTHGSYWGKVRGVFTSTSTGAFRMYSGQ